MNRLQIIAKNMKYLREMQNLSQEMLARRGGMPRSTVATIETGSHNPSIENLIKVAKGLKVSVDELISKPRPSTLLIKAKDVPKVLKSGGAVMQHKILPDSIFGMEIDRLVLKAGSRMRGVPHVRNTREYFHCILGQMEIYCEGERFHLAKGDVLAFPGDVAHSYFNPGAKDAEGFSVVVVTR